MFAKARPGHRLVVIDISSRGALVEAPRPLRPGAHLELHLVTATASAIVHARVVRCAVAALDASEITYRAGLAFSDRCDVIREAPTPRGNRVP